MRVNLEYLSSIFDVFLNADTAYTNLSDFENAGIELSGQEGRFCEKFVFHMQIAIDNQLIGCRNGAVSNLKDIGIRLGQGGGGLRVDAQIRLTQEGYDFASTLNNKAVLTKLKEELKDAPFKIIFETGQKLLQHYATKKLDDFLKKIKGGGLNKTTKRGQSPLSTKALLY